MATTSVPDANYIDRQLARTRRSLKLLDASRSLLTLLLGVLMFLLTAAVVDHWIVPGGLRPWGRMLLFCLLLAGVLWYAVRCFLPLRRSINPIYAAHTIEQTSPGLKNSLVNLLWFRGHRRPLPAKVYQALEQQAVERLAAAPNDQSLDQSSLLRLGYALVAAVAVSALYGVVSPKNLFASAGRVLAPWSNIPTPSRVQILDIQPGDATLARGETLNVSAEVLDVDEDDEVRLVYTTLDGQRVEEAIPMTAKPGELRFAGQLANTDHSSESSNGVRQELFYWIEAGDARSPQFRVRVFSRPTLVVHHVRYDFPAYTGYPSQVVQNTGNLSALEGTRVTLTGLANHPIAEAHVDFEADGRHDLKMSVESQQATASFELALRDDRRTPLHTSYVLRLKTAEGRRNGDPVKYLIDVTPDYAPEVEFVEPEQEQVDLKIDQTLRLTVEARDPDFALASVRVIGRLAGRRPQPSKPPAPRPIPRGIQLFGDDPARDMDDGQDFELGLLLTQPHTGAFRGAMLLTPADARWRPGDVIEYWAEARDNRRPQPNVAISERRKIHVVDSNPQPAEPDEHQGGKGDRQPQERAEGEAGAPQQGGSPDKGNGQPQNGADQGGEQQDPGQGAAGPPNNAGENAQNSNGADGQSADGQSADGQSTDGQSADGQRRDEQSPNAKPSEPSEAGQDAAEQGESSNEVNQNPANPANPDQSRDQSGDPGSESSPKVSPDGDNDAEAFDRIRKFLEQQQPNGGGQSGDPAQGDAAQGDPAQGDPAQGDPAQGDPAQGDPAQGDTTQGDSAQGNDQKQPHVAQSPNNPSRDARSQEAGGTQDQSESQNAPDGQGGELPNESDEPTDKPSGDPTGEQGSSSDPPQDRQQSRDPKGSGGEDDQDQPAGGQNKNQGEGGAGQQGDRSDGAPLNDQTQKPREKSDRPDKGKPLDDQEPPSAAASKTESDSEGGPSGDQAGGGQQGAGQHADQHGTGAPGANTPHDEGAGGAEQPGTGEETRPGNQQQADRPTGESSGDQPGKGSAEGDQRGDASQQAQPGDPSSEPSIEKQQDQGSNEESNASPQTQHDADSNGAQQNDPQRVASPASRNSDGATQSPHRDAQGGAAQPQSGGSNGGVANSGANADLPDQEDAANLEYARQQTDLVLERLADQMDKNNVDRKLLDKLGWKPEEMRRFLERWKGLKDRAGGEESDADEAQRQLDGALRSLGLRRNGPLRIDGSTKADELRDLNDAYRGRIPLQYLDQVRAYVKGASQNTEK